MQESSGLVLDCQRALGASGSHAPTGQLPRPLRHTLNICAHWCQLPLAGLGHSCGGLTGQAGLNIDSQGGKSWGRPEPWGLKGGRGAKAGVFGVGTINLWP